MMIVPNTFAELIHYLETDMHRGRGQPSDLYRLCRDGKDERVADPVDPETCAPSEPNYLPIY